MNNKLAKYFSGELSHREIEKMHSWRNESDDNAKEFLEAKNIWATSQSNLAPDRAILDKIFGEEKEEAKVVSIGSRWIRYAAAIVLLVGVALVVNNFLKEDQKGYQMLADGSEITLHGESVIHSINIDENIREVRLEGKAYFDIKRDESRPFIIWTDNARIEVLGTSFVIDSDDVHTEVSVESGLVALIKPGDQGKTDLSVKLAEGEVGMIENETKGITKRNNTNVNYLAWKTKTLTFERASMASVEEILEDVYGIDIQFENENLKNCSLTAKFKERRAKDAIEIIAKTFGLTFEMKKEKVILKGRGC